MNPKQAKRLGAYLAAARMRADLSQAGLGTLVRVPNSTILRLERGDILNPRAELLAQIAEVLDVSLADVYALADYAAPDQLPTLLPYLRTKYRALPEEAANAIVRYAERLATRYEVDLTKPGPGGNEQPIQPTRKRSTKGGTNHAGTTRTAR